MSFIDPVTIPILMKVLDFFFDEGSRILEQRRKRNSAKEIASKVSEDQTEVDISVTASHEAELDAKESVLSQKISDVALKAHQKSLEHLLEMKQIYSERYDLARKKLAIAGEAEVSYKVLYEIGESERELAKVMEEIRVTLTNLVGKPIDNVELALYRKTNPNM